jgi:hypothetical protein
MLSSSPAQGRLLLFASVMAVLAMATGAALFTTALAVAVTVGWLAAGRQTLLEAAEAELQHATDTVATAVRHRRARRASTAAAAAPRRRRSLALFEALATRKVKDPA